MGTGNENDPVDANQQSSIGREGEEPELFGGPPITPLQRRVQIRADHEAARGHQSQWMEDLDTFRGDMRSRDRRSTIFLPQQHNQADGRLDNPYEFRETENIGVDSATLKELKLMGVFFHDKANFDDLKLRGANGIVELPHLVEIVTERLELCGVSCLRVATESRALRSRLQNTASTPGPTIKGGSI